MPGFSPERGKEMCSTVRLAQRVERAFSMGTVEGACLTGGSSPSGAHLINVKCGALWPWQEAQFPCREEEEQLRVSPGTR